MWGTTAIKRAKSLCTLELMKETRAIERQLRRQGFAGKDRSRMRGRGDSGRAKGWIESEYERHKQMRRKKSGTCILEGMSTAIVVPACSERSRERETLYSGDPAMTDE